MTGVALTFIAPLRYLTVEPTSRPDTAWVDGLSQRLSASFSWLLAQVCGVAKIPIVLAVVLLGHVLG